MVKSKGEPSIQRIMAPDPDARIKRPATLFITKYADSELKGQGYCRRSILLSAKGRDERMAVYLEQTIAADPKHYGAMLMLAKSIAQRT